MPPAAQRLQVMRPILQHAGRLMLQMSSRLTHERMRSVILQLPSQSLDMLSRAQFTTSWLRAVCGQSLLRASPGTKIWSLHTTCPVHTGLGTVSRA